MQLVLENNPLLLLFVITAVGYTVGRVPLGGMRLGSAAILFVGLLFGALNPQFTLPDFVVRFGLVLFLYAIGLANGANFFRAFQHEGQAQIWFILLVLTVPAGLTLALLVGMGLTGAAAAGLFAGAGTNTAALAGVLDLLKEEQAPATAVAQTAVAFALAYPAGVLGRIVVITLMQWVWGIDFSAEAEQLHERYPINQEVQYAAIRVTQPAVVGQPLRDLQRQQGWEVIFGRWRRQGTVGIASGETRLALGDIVMIAGERHRVAAVIAALGEQEADELLNDDTVYVRRRLFVSNPDIVGQPLASLDLKERFGAIIVRVRRGDSDLLASRETILELGDRVQLLARRTDMTELTALLGDSYEAVSQVNLLSLGFGLSFGLLLGMVQIGLPGGLTVQLGFAVGTLLVALVLGALRRTGAIVWTLPYGVNQTLQQVGLFLLLAGIGVQSGNALEGVVQGRALLGLATAALVLVMATTWVGLWVGYRLFKIPFSILAGMLASQPAVLSYVLERVGNPLPGIGFALAMPIGIMLTVVYAQLIWVLFGG